MRTRIYVAGPYTRPDPGANTRAAMDAGHRLLDAGYAPMVPHLTHYMELHRARPYEDWLQLDLAWVAVSDAVLRLPGESSGADRETALAARLGIPVYHDLGTLLREVPASAAGVPS
jgi:hypothetical protein